MATLAAGRSVRNVRPRSKAWRSAGVASALAGLAGCASGGRPTAMQTALPAAAPTTTTPTTTTPTSVAQRCSTTQLLLTAQWEPGAVPYGADPAHKQSAGEMVERIRAVNQGPACLLSGVPGIGIVSSTGAVLKVQSEAARQWCQYSCGTPRQQTLASGAAVLAGMHWQPSYCGPDPGSRVLLRVALTDSTSVTIPVQNPVGAGKPIYAPSCTPALGETRLTVESFGDRQG